MSPHELKALQVQLSKAKADEQVKREAMISAQREHKEVSDRIAVLNSRLSEAMKEPVVTEHALLRYVERVYGINLEEIKASILTPTTVKAIKTLGSGKYPLTSGGKAVVKGMSVVSIVD